MHKYSEFFSSSSFIFGRVYTNFLKDGDGKSRPAKRGAAGIIYFPLLKIRKISS